MYIEQLTEELSIDELIDRLIFIDKIESRLQESIDNKVIEESELQEELEKWLK